MPGPGDERRMWPTGQGAGGSRSKRPGTETEKVCLKDNAEKGNLRTSWVNWPRGWGQMGWGAERMSVPVLPSTDPTAAGQPGRKATWVPEQEEGDSHTAGLRGSPKVSAETEQRRPHRRGGGSKAAEARKGKQSRSGGPGCEEGRKARAKGLRKRQRGEGTKSDLKDVKPGGVEGQRQR